MAKICGEYWGPAVLVTIMMTLLWPARIAAQCSDDLENYDNVDYHIAPLAGCMTHFCIHPGEYIELNPTIGTFAFDLCNNDLSALPRGLNLTLWGAYYGWELLAWNTTSEVCSNGGPRIYYTDDGGYNVLDILVHWEDCGEYPEDNTCLRLDICNLDKDSCEQEGLYPRPYTEYVNNVYCSEFYMYNNEMVNLQLEPNTTYTFSAGCSIWETPRSIGLDLFAEDLDTKRLYLAASDYPLLDEDPPCSINPLAVYIELDTGDFNTTEFKMVFNYPLCNQETLIDPLSIFVCPLGVCFDDNDWLGAEAIPIGVCFSYNDFYYGSSREILAEGNATYSVDACDEQEDIAFTFYKAEQLLHSNKIPCPNNPNKYIYTYATEKTEFGDGSFRVLVDRPSCIPDLYPSSYLTVRICNLEIPTPVLTTPMPDQEVVIGRVLRFRIPSNLFHDVQGTFIYEVTLSDGSPLPDWIEFRDDATADRVFTITPTNITQVGDYSIRIRATYGSEMAEDHFLLTVLESPSESSNIYEFAMLGQQFSHPVNESYFQELFDLLGDPPMGAIVWNLALADGNPAPSWLHLSTTPLEIYGTPNELNLGELKLLLSGTYFPPVQEESKRDEFKASDKSDSSHTMSNRQIVVSNPYPIHITVTHLVAYNLDQVLDYNEDEPIVVNLPPMMIQRSEPAIVSAELKLSHQNVGIFDTLQPSVISIFDHVRNSFLAVGDVALVNQTLAQLVFIPTPNSFENFFVDSMFDDGVSPIIRPHGLGLFFRGHSVNDPPELKQPLLDRNFFTNEIFDFTIDTEEYFDDVDGDVLNVTVVNATDLPSWLSINIPLDNVFQFSGLTPDEEETVEVSLSVSDPQGLTILVSFKINIFLDHLPTFLPSSSDPLPTSDSDEEEASPSPSDDEFPLWIVILIIVLGFLLLAFIFGGIVGYLWWKNRSEGGDKYGFGIGEFRLPATYLDKRMKERTVIGGRYYQMTWISKKEAATIANQSGLIIPFEEGETETKYALGKGAFGNLKIAYDSQTGQFVASKKVKGEKNVKLSKDEADLQNKCNGMPHIMPILSTCEIPEKEVLYHFMPLAGYGNGRMLQEYIKHYGVDTETAQQAIRITAKGLLTGLSNMHSIWLFHLDLKPENIVLQKDGTLLITDFGCVQETFKAGRIFHDNGDTRYFSPERVRSHNGRSASALKNGLDGAKLDAWAAGMILFELVVGEFPLEVEPGQSVKDRLNAWTREYFNRRLSGYKGWSQPQTGTIWEVIKSLMEIHPDKRATPQQALKLSYFSSSSQLSKEQQEKIFSELKIKAEQVMFNEDEEHYNNESDADSDVNAIEMQSYTLDDSRSQRNIESRHATTPAPTEYYSSKPKPLPQIPNKPKNTASSKSTKGTDDDYQNNPNTTTAHYELTPNQKQVESSKTASKSKFKLGNNKGKPMKPSNRTLTRTSTVYDHFQQAHYYV